MRRRFAWLLLLAGTALVGFSLARPIVTMWALALGLVVWGAGLFLLPVSDVLGDHPDEARERELEDRRRRGAAGWQKPVAPPRPGSRPGGLPPRRREW